jgi:hypothetical protein
VDQAWFGQLRAAARRAGERPVDQLVGMFDALATACRRDGYHGCAFINTAAESRAGASDPELLARQLTMLLDGGLSAGVLDADGAAPQGRAGGRAGAGRRRLPRCLTSGRGTATMAAKVPAAGTPPRR